MNTLTELKWIRISLGILATITLGAIGSGVWEFLRSPVISIFGTISIGLDRLSGTYLDSLHEGIGNANRTSILYPLAMSFFFLVVIANASGVLLFVKIRRLMLDTNTNTPPTPQKIPHSRVSALVRSRRFFVGMVLVCLFNIFAYSNDLFAYNYRLGAVTWTERSIEILRPKLSEQEFLELRAAYRSVEDSKSFYALRASIIGFAVKNHITLPKFRAIAERRDLTTPSGLHSSTP